MTGPHGHDFYLKCRNGSNSEVVYGHGDLPLQDEEEELWKRRETPAEVMLVKEELTHMRHEGELFETLSSSSVSHQKALEKV